MLFELVASTEPSGAKIGHMLAPRLHRSGTGYLVFPGLGDWPGLDVPELAVPAGFRSTTSVRLNDVVWSLPLAAGVAALVVASRRFALDDHRPPSATAATVTLLVGGLRGRR